ncbi:MAG: hypothetical protein K2W33_04540 [Burkholderiales bacterium]|nr:hypothetical protein [Burkholderiales bacterium]
MSGFVHSQRIEYGGLALEDRLTGSGGFADALKRMQIDIKCLQLCVEQTLSSFEAAGGCAEDLDRQHCLYYCAQSMLSSVVLSMGDWEAIVVNSQVDMAAPGVADKLDELVSAEMFRIGFFNPLDTRAVRQYKHLVFMESWKFSLDVNLLRCGTHLQASVARVICNTKWVENGFVLTDETEESFA